LQTLIQQNIIQVRQAAPATSNINFGGQGDNTTGIVNTENYDGTSWTEVADLNLGRRTRGIGDSSTAALCVGGSTPPSFTANTESWNGTAWTEVNNLNTARGYFGCGGTSTNGLVFGGAPPDTLAVTEAYDGTSWTEVNDLATGRNTLGGTGSGTLALAIGGSPYASTVEEWTVAHAIKTIALS